MSFSLEVPFCRDLQGRPTARAPQIVIGITDSQTCLTMTGRLRALREAGFSVTAVSSPGPLLEHIGAEEKVRVIALPMRRGIAPLCDLISFVRLWRLLCQLRPAMVEFSTPKAGLLGMMAAALCHIPVRIYLLRGLKLEASNGLKRQLLLAMERLTARCAHVVLCNSQSLRKQALALQVAPHSKLQILGDGSTNGVDVERFCPGPTDVRKRLGLSPNEYVIGFVGRLTRDKGILELIAAFETILKAERASHLLLVGWFDASDDALDRAARERIENHPRIHYTGFVSDPAPYYRAMDLLVLPTWREGFPNVVLEAAATSIPVITTICTGSRDSVVPEVTGLLIPPGCPEAISEAVINLLRNPERMHRMGRKAREWVLKHYDRKCVLDQVAGYYTDLLQIAGERVVTRQTAEIAIAGR